MMLKKFVLAPLLVSVCLSLWSQREGLVVQWSNELRELKAQRLHAARALDILKDYSTVIRAVSERPVTIESLTLSLIEMVKLRSVSLDVQLTSLTVTELSESERIEGSLPSLRVEFDGVLHRAIDLLSLFDAVREVADWRPIEVRGCSLVREADESRLHAVCSIDVHYFPGLDT